MYDKVFETVVNWFSSDGLPGNIPSHKVSNHSLANQRVKSDLVNFKLTPGNIEAAKLDHLGIFPKLSLPVVAEWLERWWHVV